MDKETKINRWVDGELSGDELRAFEAEMAENPELRNEAEGAKRVGAILRQGLEADIEPPAAEFFNAQIGKRIREGAVAEVVPEAGAVAAGGAGNVVPMMKAPWLVAAAACLVAVFSILSRPSVEPKAEVAGVYVPVADVTADVYVDEEVEATVIMFEGLEEIPAEREVKPFSVASYEPTNDGKAVFYAANDPEKALYVMHKVGNGAPIIHEL